MDLQWLNVKKPIQDLKPYEFNPRTISKKEMKKLTESIKASGFYSPIIIDFDDTIIAGHQRWKALQSLGVTEVDARQSTRKLTDAEFQRLNVSDNVEYGVWDFDVLANHFELGDLIEWGIDPDDLPPLLSEESEGLTGDDETPTPPVEPTSKRGDLYQLGDHFVMCGDATNQTDVERLMQGQKADMVFTDPPYNVAGRSKNFVANSGVREGKAHDKLSESDWDQDFKIEDALATLVTVLSESFTAYIWTSHYLIQRIWDFFQNYDFTGYLVWAKGNPMPSLAKRHPCFNSELCAYIAHGKDRTVNYPDKGHFLSVRTVNQTSSNQLHPTQKPVELIKPLIEFSSNPQQIVLDLFGGSGSTLIACEKLKRRCYMMELDPKYVDTILKRYADYTGNEPKLVKQS